LSALYGKVTRDQVIAVTMIKWFRHVVEAYSGPLEGFRAYLCSVLNEKNFKADAILAEAATEIL